MNRHKYSERIMLKSARMYYEEGLNQSQISEKLQISKSSVSRILSEAREVGIVKITVENPFKNEFIGLEQALEKKFNLKEVIVVEGDHPLEDDIKIELGKAAGEYLKRVVKDGQLIGVTWGSTLREIPKFIRNDNKKDITFIPMVGGLGEVNIGIHPNYIALELSRAFNAKYKAFHAPFVVSDVEVKKHFIQDKNIREFYSLFENLDIGIIGIGCPLHNKSTLLKSNYYTEEEIKNLGTKGAVADIGSQFIDKNGEYEKFEINQRILGIDLEDIKKIPLSIGVAGSLYKKEAILAAIRGKFINVLIVDSMTGKALLDT